MHKICTIIPVYNEASRLEYDVFLEFVKQNTNHYLLFVNDGSTDGSLDILKKLNTQSNNNIFFIDLQKNLGKGEAIRAGVLWIKANLEVEYFGYIDADLATPLSEIRHINSAFENKNYNIAFGSRIKLYGSSINRSIKRHYLGRIFATFVSLFLKLDIYDTQCGAKYFRNNADVFTLFQEKFISRWFFDIEIFIRYKNNVGINKFKETTKEIPLNIWTEKGDSKLKTNDFIFTPIELLKIGKHYRNSAK
ncbi:MAG: hypothetical protein B6I18_06125 [Bacteroidetes bacterium 4572_112]|nr:MAG: hypothetical protein B6I18_06125 [Bacteroidetes bacterium 4572_112]